MEGNTMVPSSSSADTNVEKQQYSSPDDSETFYAKLTELLDSSGYTLIFNVRKTTLDLYQFYLEVTRRGGFYQVGQENKWGEVASALKMEGNIVKLSFQVEKLYALLLYKFEKLYFYRCPGTGSTKGSVKRKWNSTTTLSQSMDNKDDQTVAKISKDYSSQITGGPSYQVPTVLVQVPSNDKEMKKRRRGGAGARPGQRNGYQIFLKQECARLKASRPDIEGRQILRVAVDAWNKLSDIDKQPYIEESQKIKEKSKEAMNIPNNQKSTQNLKRDEKKPSVCGTGDYCVTSEPLANYSFVNNAAVDLALKMTEKTSKDTFFLDFGAYHSLDLPTGESK